ncbi:ubiquitin carboxyl-terminal hydrolase [Mucidula mucida]|nr:ubiquitin carboxyl-terminal hydrolase [Mucidula mucida]
MSEGEDSNGWQLMESDPGVFTELLKTLGVPLVVDDLYSLDPDSLAQMQPIRAFIFLFKWLPTLSSAESSSMAGEYDPSFPGFFAHQVVNNACATLAVLNGLGNIPSLTFGPQLSELMSFASALDPQTRGLAITSSDWLREAHNSLSPPSAISLDGLGLPKKTEEAYHFVVYLPAMGSLYELDGLKPHAVRHGHFEESGEGWLKVARLKRISTYPPGSLEFSLLALRDDPLPTLQAQLNQLQLAGLQSEAAEFIVKISQENSKREQWAFESSVRRHNHVGLVHALVLALARADKLEGAKEAAKGVMKDRVEKAKTKGQMMDED